MKFDNYEARHVAEHYEVYKNGIFQFSADNLKEAREEITEMRDK